MDEPRWSLHRAVADRYEGGPDVLVLPVSDPHLPETTLVITAEPGEALTVMALLPNVYRLVNTRGPLVLPLEDGDNGRWMDRNMKAITTVTAEDLDISCACYSAKDLKEQDHLPILRREWLENRLPDRVLLALVHLAAYGGSVPDTIWEINRVLADRIQA